MVLLLYSKPFYYVQKQRCSNPGQNSSITSTKKKTWGFNGIYPFKNPTFFFYGKEGTFISLDQSMISYNLSYEISLLLEAAISDLEFAIIEQEILLKWKKNNYLQFW